MSENQKARSPAQVYDEFFVPALFHPWTCVVADAADVEPGQRVLDVACGTGVLACTLAERVGLGGSVVGLDPSEEMLEVARTKSDSIEWRTGRAESIPFPDESFDAVASQFGIMFFDDPGGALREMMRVMRPGGRLAVAVCDALENSPGTPRSKGCCDDSSAIGWRALSAHPLCLATRKSCSPCAPMPASSTQESHATMGRFASRRFNPWSPLRGPASGRLVACLTTSSSRSSQRNRRERCKALLESTARSPSRCPHLLSQQQKREPSWRKCSTEFTGSRWSRVSVKVY